ncbi:hypothetical protein FHG87_002598, partial [Trinorchestia longiramus]
DVTTSFDSDSSGNTDDNLRLYDYRSSSTTDLDDLTDLTLDGRRRACKNDHDGLRYGVTLKNFGHGPGSLIGGSNSRNRRVP